MLPHITMTGRLAFDPELRFTPSGVAVTNLRLGSNDSRKDESGNWVNTEECWINLTLWREEAENAVEHWRKGDQVFAAGRLYEREYETRDGNKGKSLEIKNPAVRHFPRDDSGRPAPQRQQPAEQPWGSSSAPAEPPF